MVGRPDIVSRNKASSHPLMPGRFYDAKVKRVEDDGRVVIVILELGITLGPLFTLNTTEIQFLAVDDFVKCTFTDEFFREIIIFGSVLKKASVYVAKSEIVWSAFSPTISQGTSTNVTKTIDYSRYSLVGATCSWNCKLSITGTGDGGSPILVTLPEPSAAPQGCVVGNGIVTIAATNHLVPVVIYDSQATKVAFALDPDGYLGDNPSHEIDNSDIISMAISYEVSG